MKPKEQKLDLALLEKLLDYDPVTGIFIWKMSRSRTTCAGDVAGMLTRHGYWSITVKGTKYQAHRLAWFYFYGVWPKADLDHKNGVTYDCAIGNLREATKSQNICNSKRKGGRYGRGVHVHGKGKKFSARLTVNKSTMFLGFYATQQEAALAYEAASKKYHGEFSFFNR